MVMVNDWKTLHVDENLLKTEEKGHMQTKTDKTGRGGGLKPRSNGA